MRVEDEPSVALVVEYALYDAGHQILGPIPTSMAAYSLAMNEHPDFALIDIRLADGKTGPALAQRLFTDFGIRSLYLTGNKEDAKKAREGSFGYIEKPYKLEAVVEALKALDRIIKDEGPYNIPESLKLFPSASAR
jgi:two-component system, response regulator PdtaR